MIVSEKTECGQVGDLSRLMDDPENFGCWLALNRVSGSYELIARGETAEEVYEAAGRAGIPIPIVTKLPEPGTLLFY